MKIKNTKIFAYVLIVVGIISLCFMVKSIISRASAPAFLPSEENSPGEEVITEESSSSSGEEVGAASEVEEKEDPLPEDTDEDFDDIVSILIYDLHPEIEKLLNARKFDEELKAFLLERELIPEIAFDGDDAPSGVFLITSIDYLTKDLEREVYIFDVKVDNEKKSVLSVSVLYDDYLFEVR